jgi:hypothetical protein
MGGVSRGFNRALGLNRGGTLNRAFGGNQNLAIAVAAVTAIAIPFAAPVVASAVFGSTSLAALTATSAALGAAGGAVSGSLTGNVGRGALIGGAGGAVSGFAQGGGFTEVGNALFGPSTAPAFGGASTTGYEALAAPAGGFESAAATGGGFAGGSTPLTAGELAVAGAAPTAGGTTIGIGGAVSAPSIGGMTPEQAMASLPSTPTPATTGVASAAPQGTQLERFLGGITGSGTKMDLTTAEGVGRVLSPIVSPSGIAGVGQLAMTMYNRPPESLTPQERSFVNETAELAGTNRALFEQRVNSARRLLQQGTPNPEEAYAQASMGVQRRFREAGLRDAGDVRRGLIEGARLGAAAIPGEYTRAASLTQQGLSAMPSTAPQGAEGMALPVYRDLERRQREYQADLGRGFGTLASAFGGRSKGGLFSS